MSDTLVLFGFALNLVGVFIAIFQTRVSIERRLTALETYMKIIIRDKGISIRSTDAINFKDENDK